MPTKPRSVTIELTPKQREKLRKVTGEERSEIQVVLGGSAKKQLSAKVAPRGAIFKGGDKVVPGEGGMPVV